MRKKHTSKKAKTTRPAPAKSKKSVARKRNAVNFDLSDTDVADVREHIKQLVAQTGVPMTLGAYAKAATIAYFRLREYKLESERLRLQQYVAPTTADLTAEEIQAALGTDDDSSEESPSGPFGSTTATDDPEAA